MKKRNAMLVRNLNVGIIRRQEEQQKKWRTPIGILHLHSFAKKYRKTIILKTNLIVIYRKCNSNMPSAKPSR